MLMRMFVANEVARLGGWLDWVAITLYVYSTSCCTSESWSAPPAMERLAAKNANAASMQLTKSR